MQIAKKLKAAIIVFAIVFANKRLMMKQKRKYTFKTNPCKNFAIFEETIYDEMFINKKSRTKFYIRI